MSTGEAERSTTDGDEIEAAALIPMGTVKLFSVVLLPLAALFVELSMRACRESFFDPLPTLLHIPLVAAGPAYWILTRRFAGTPRGRRSLAFLCGMAAVAGAGYSLAFLPLLPLAVVGILLFGLGLLPLAPIVSFAWIVGPVFRLIRGGGPRRTAVCLGGLAGLLILALPMAVGVLMAGQVRKAISPSHGTHMEAVRELRKLRMLGADRATAKAAETGESPGFLELYTGRSYGDGVQSLYRSRDLSPRQMDRAAEAYYRAFGTRPPRRWNFDGAAAQSRGRERV